jgi:hypothetical protein
MWKQEVSATVRLSDTSRSFAILELEEEVPKHVAPLAIGEYPLLDGNWVSEFPVDDRWRSG